MRLIDADALISVINGDAFVADGVKDYVRYYVGVMPTIEPERKTGHWILVTDNNGQHFICDHCGEWRYHQNQKFCGECGAKMEGAEPEDIPMEYFESGGR